MIPTQDTTTLHVYLADHGQVLATRSHGREVADHLRAVSDRPGDIIVDFSDVEAATPPFLQELVDAMQSIILRAPDSGRIVLIAHMNEDVEETLGYVMGRKKRAVAYSRGDTIELIEAKPHLVETLREALTLRSFTAPDLAKKLSIAHDTATQRLRRLLEAGAVVREQDPEAKQGIRHVYRVANSELVAPPPEAAKIRDETQVAPG